MKKKLIFTCLCLFLLETHSVPLHKVFYISQIIAYFVSTWESRPPRYTACQSQALIRFFKCYFNYFRSQNNIIINIASLCFLFLYFFILTRNNTCTMYGTSLLTERKSHYCLIFYTLIEYLLCFLFQLL